jgi:endonuclease/exonuclease/phosphatase family metal-dependent hydrolase
LFGAFTRKIYPISIFIAIRIYLGEINMKLTVWINIFLCIMGSYSASLLSAVEFTVLNYNVQMRPLLDDNDYKGKIISPKLNHYNIAALQESFSGKNILMNEALHPFKAHFTQKRCMFCLVDSGLSTLSDFEIIEKKSLLYRSWAGIQDGVASKGVLLTRLLINGNILDIYNTHMIASSDICGANSARHDQATQLIDFVKENSPDTHSVLVLGDFNMCPSHLDASEDDRIFKAKIFSMILKKLDLKDTFDSLIGPRPHDIHRILFRSGLEHGFRPLAIEQHNDFFVDKNNVPLSDSPAQVGIFTIASKKIN